MAAINLIYSDWVQLSKAEKVIVCRQIAAQMADMRVQFREIGVRRFCGRVEEVAIFEQSGKPFVLIPSCEATIGFDVDSFVPTALQQANYDKIREELNKPWSLLEFVRMFTTPVRTVKIKTMLVACAADFVGRVPADPSDPAVRDLIDKGEPGTGVLAGDLEAAFFMDGSYEIWRHRDITHKQVIAEFAAQGCRLPTSDEWEYLCGAGATTLYRWGNDNPPDKYPTDSYESMARSGIARDLTESEFFLHDEPNCFLLEIAQNPYDSELVSEPGVVRGGDGGGSISGGLGYFVGWLPLATAYLDVIDGANYLEGSVHDCVARRVIDVP
ncbi:MAG: hypothetical protein IPL73_10540 [Candidatus Obscuribacter sp.]|nr:hypothetical protein [Candidatus Obscuribacter sp.]